MKIRSRLAALGGVVVAGALALTACGSDDNTTTSPGSAPSGAIDCATGSINAAGSSAQKNAIEEWTKVYAAECAGANLNYNPSGSGAGIQAFTSGQVAFAGSDSALDEEEAAAARQRCQGNPALNLPMVVGPVAVVYNLPGVDGLKLSPETIAKIFSGKVKTWNDPAIAADNEGADLPSSEIKPVYRSDESGTTDNFTDYLHSTVPDEWTWEPAKKWPNSTGQGAAKSDGVTSQVKNTEGAISYVEMSYATNNKLQTAHVKNGAGEFTELSPESASKAVAGAKVVGTGNDVALEIDYTTEEAGAYPIVLVTYEIACEKGLPAEQAEFVKSFLTYTSSADGQKILTERGYAPIPQSVLTKVQASVKALS
ncbi:phosphate transport system substrate-binding protein [Actinomadura hallensis]|uniref:Phosphate-binding protein n=1 Tax=Actinomadura hallensis TaxID=337895 RepID=A0A543I9D8_9ACTN|nr:phosphate ABC transporter substrate-binding protein PstS [Actinomadura hallensis]TQM67177.1 phosphate transport system substrate-binding protein [Actinomadura hallensis]HLV72954.1 phosphate ABC transporter substrate-binding protein PstS [Vulgatibacteraceae bacterium]